MPQAPAFNPLTLTKFIAWIAVSLIATLLLARRKMTTRTRLAFVAGGVVLFGFIYGALLAPALNPNPPSSLRTVLTGWAAQGRVALPVLGMLVLLLLITWLSNKVICGYGCQLGLLQDLIHRVRLPKWQPPFWLSNRIRALTFVSLVAVLSIAGLDWMGAIDPFQLFQFNLTLPITLTVGAVLGASLFVYRPWCRFLCPFGFASWIVEQVSLFRPRVNRDACEECLACVRACPSGAMADFYDGKRIHADCFACGACIEACKVKDALGWWRK
ncbi:MAG: 4Fe-4S binding protein [Anaerolineae bacterium]